MCQLKHKTSFAHFLQLCTKQLIKMIIFNEIQRQHSRIFIHFNVFFYMNKDFHLRMNFSLNIINYNSIRKRIEAEKINDIVNWMQKLLKFDQKHMKKIKSIMRKQINKHRKKMKYQIDNSVRFSSKNIKITRFLKKLNNRMFNSFKIIEKMNVFYCLKLFSNMHQHDVFLFNYLKFAINNSLSNQK